MQKTDQSKLASGRIEVNIHRLGGDETGYEASTRVLKNERGLYFCEQGETSDEALRNLADAICGNNPSSDASATFKSFVIAHDERVEEHQWTGEGPQLQEETLSDGSKVYNVTLSDETFFCRDERSALRLINDLNEVVKRACE